MIPRTLRHLPELVYPSDDWSIVETAFTQRWMGQAETIFALSNGFIGTRGTFEEGRPSVEPATLLNGFHETWPIVHAEQAYGFARTGQTIVNAPDATLMKLYVDDEPLYLPTARITDYRRTLDMRAGVLRRALTWVTPAGISVRLISTRLISFVERHLGAIDYTLETDADVPVVISSQLLNRQDARALDEPGNGNGRIDPRRGRPFQSRVLSANEHVDRDHRLITGWQTARSGMSLGAGIDHVVDTDASWYAQRVWDQDVSKFVVTAEARAGVPLRMTKFFTYHTSRHVPSRELVDRSERTLDRAVRTGFDSVAASQHQWLDDTWTASDIEVDGPDRVQQAVRWNIFQLLQASARAETAGIPAKGLTGLAYEGHYFWDTEVYVAPFLTYTSPRVARNLLRFRYGMLDDARSRAAELSERGALFPWRTINGEEASSYYAAGTAQYHINADVAYGIRRYVDVRGDRSVLAEVGGEILIETARMWAGLGFFSPRSGAFHIHGVTGPDEYTTVVNDNAFTNLMARVNLSYAADVITQMSQDDPQAYHRLAQATDLDFDEVHQWRRAAAAMYVPFDDKRGIHPQDENFLSKEVWDFSSTPADHYPLLLHYHPLVIYRHQVIKQADVVLAMVLLGNEFDIDQKRRNFVYYDPLTTGDSSLSAAMQSILAAEIGFEEKALEYFQYALFMDLADVAGNVADGVHVASAGGVWMALTYGFAGMRDFNGQLSFSPRLPANLGRISFRLKFHDRILKVDLRHDREQFAVIEGEPVEITVRGVTHKLTVAGGPLEVEPPDIEAVEDETASTPSSDSNSRR